MLPQINNSTRITNHSATLVDSIFSNAFVISHNIGILVNGIRDHFPIFTIREEYLVISKDATMVLIYEGKKQRQKEHENIM